MKHVIEKALIIVQLETLSDSQPTLNVRAKFMLRYPSFVYGVDLRLMDW